jgi:hypothetical protein
MKKRILGVFVMFLLAFSFSQNAQAVLSPADQLLAQQITAQITSLQKQLSQMQTVGIISNTANQVQSVVGINAGSQSFSVDLKASGSDGPLSSMYGASHSFQWDIKNSVGMTRCILSASPVWGLGVNNVVSSNSSIDASFQAVVGPFTKSETMIIICGDSTGNVANDSVQVNITSVPPPTQSTVSVDLKANGSDGPISITNGTSVTLTWSSKNSSTCFSSLTGVVLTSGTQSTGNLTNSRTYTMSCSNYSGSVSVDSVVVNVAQAGVVTTSGSGAGTIPAPVVTLSLTPISISNSQSSTIKWSSTGATSCMMKLSSTALYPNGFSYVMSLSGSDVVNPTQTVTYTATCTNSAGISGSDTKTLTVGGSTGGTTGGTGGGGATPVTPTTTSDAKPMLSVNPSYNFGTSAVNPGTTSVLDWSSTGATICIGPNWLQNPGTTGSQSVGPIWPPATYTLTCFDSNNVSASASVTFTAASTVSATPSGAPPTINFSINPNYNFGTSDVTPGSFSVLDWSTTDATSCLGPNWLMTPGVGPGSQAVGPIWPPDTYTITCDGPGGTSSASIDFTAK